MENPTENNNKGGTATTNIEEPDNLCCIISRALFRDPVLAAGSGNTYEREALLTHFSACEANGSPIRDPITNRVIGKDVITNWDKRRQVQDFLDANPTFVPDGWASRDLPQPNEDYQAPPFRADNNRRGPGHHHYELNVDISLDGNHVFAGALVLLAWYLYKTYG
eukprot:m.233093 g.233093  ORF g.233093 m.233093 type:complete len:165 (-) comp33632_c1_seq1:33-527(-)